MAIVYEGFDLVIHIGMNLDLSMVVHDNPYYSVSETHAIQTVDLT